MRYYMVIFFLFALFANVSRGNSPFAISYDLETARIAFNQSGGASVQLPDGKIWAQNSTPIFELITESKKSVPATKVQKTNSGISITFEDGSQAEFKVKPGKGFLLFQLNKFEPKQSFERFQIMNLPIPSDSKIAGMTNTAYSGGYAVSVMTAAPNVHPLGRRSVGTHHDRAGCSHQFVPNENAKQGKYSARFTASCNEKGGGWAVQGRRFNGNQDFTGCKAIRAWVHGDGQRQALKIQLGSGQGHRDDYIPINFKGWKQIELTKPALNDLDYSNVADILFYYNGMPAGKTVECLIDQVEMVLDDHGKEKIILLEDFESSQSALWDNGNLELSLETVKRHGLTPVVFGIVATPEDQWVKVVPEFQTAAGIPSPRLGGVWNKISPWIKESYFFLTNFKESEYDEALAIAKRGNFKMILLLCTWTDAHGHYKIRTAHYPEGFESLKRTFERFNAEGIKVGLHFLAASIDYPDPYLTPVPDKRLVTGAEVTLARPIDEKSDFIETNEPPTDFPKTEVKTYTEAGRTLWIDDELIYYDTVSTEKPYGFTKCKRGFRGTKKAAHQQNAKVRHLVRAYGYYMFDLDSTLAGEIADHVAETVNKLNVDMIYFDGSERLQKTTDGRDHWYYNAILHKTFFDRFKNKNILYQASSTSPYSWHQMARTASADGHDDLRAYLEERSGGFKSYFSLNHLPLDIGWYYAYDKKATPDMYEYILTKSIAYDSSMSLQTSVAAAKAHPFIGEILDMIRVYDDLRLTGRVPKEIRELMEIDPALFGIKSEEERNKILDKRRDYHFTKKNGQEGFQRVIYDIWQPIEPSDSNEFLFEMTVKNGKSKIGFDVQVRDEKTMKNAEIVNPKIEITGTDRKLLLPMTLSRGQYGFYRPGEKLAQFGAPLTEGKYFDQKGELLELDNGTWRIRFSCDGKINVPLRVRTTQQPNEFHPIP